MQVEVGLQHLQVPARQAAAGGRHRAGLARQLDRVFRRPECGRPDRRARLDHRRAELPRLRPCRQQPPERQAQVAEVPRLLSRHVGAHAAREDDAVDVREVVRHVGQEQFPRRVRPPRPGDGRDQQVGHVRRDPFQRLGRGGIPRRKRRAGGRRQVAARRFCPDDPAVLDRDQPPAEVQRRRPSDRAPVGQRQLRRAAPDVDVQDARLPVVADLRRARSVGRQHRLHVVAGGRGQEVAPLPRHDFGDGLGVLAAQRLARQDHHAGVDVGGPDRRFGIGVVDDRAERLGVDLGFAAERREADRRGVGGLAVDDHVARGMAVGLPLQVDGRKDDLRAGRADVDPDRGQGDVVPQPDRILLQRAGVDVVVVVIGVPVVVVRVEVAEHVVVDRVTPGAGDGGVGGGAAGLRRSVVGIVVVGQCAFLYADRRSIDGTIARSYRPHNVKSCTVPPGVSAIREGTP